MIVRYLLCAVIGYLLGSISTGILVSQKAGRDIRQEGSHNTGASNALRVLGVKGGAIVFLGDFFKAALAVILGLLLVPDVKYGGMLAGLCAILGHNWSIYHSFQGGKGISCSTAVLLILFPWWQGLAAVLLCVLVIYIWRYISVGSLTMLASFSLFLISSRQPFWPTIVWSLVLFALAVYRHRSNLVRLKNGTENKIGQKV